MHRVQGIVSGRVQGVGFRYFVLQHARAAGVTGFVRNRADGSVEFLLQGEVADVQRVIDQIHCGPRYSQVDRVELIEPDSDNVYVDFIVSR